MKLHVGCGERHLEGFVNIDIRRTPQVDILMSGKDLGFRENSIDLIYACHVLEHFSRFRVSKVIAEWYRVLKPGGILRVCVPDFEAAVKVYQDSKDMRLILGLLVGGQNYLGNTHHMVFDWSVLWWMLVIVGFKNIRKYDWRATEHNDVDDYSQAYIPHMDKDHGILVSLNVECEK